jgi:hypothetical protein
MISFFAHKASGSMIKPSLETNGSAFDSLANTALNNFSVFIVFNFKNK